MENCASGYVFVVDDEPRVLTVLRKTLERAGLTVRCFSGADDCLAGLEADSCDLLITDVKMPGKDGVELLTKVKRRLPWLPVLVITGFGDVPVAVKALKAGAVDFIEKPLDRDSFLEMVRILLARNTAGSILQGRSLTRMEMKILCHVLEGKNNREIADALHRSCRTVEVHRRHVMQKLCAKNVVELLRQAARLRLFDSDHPLTEGHAASSESARAELSP
jgi:FixJ family two-component response regulator